MLMQSVGITAIWQTCLNRATVRCLHPGWWITMPSRQIFTKKPLLAAKTAQNAAIATGAEAAIIPEDQTDVDQLATFIGRGVRKSKNSSIVLVSESKKDGTGGAQYYADRLVHEYPEFEARVTILGHLQRGGIPTANDRILASRLGVAAIEALKDGQRNIMVGVKNDQIVYVPFNKAIRIDKPIDRELINVLNVLSI